MARANGLTREEQAAIKADACAHITNWHDTGQVRAQFRAAERRFRRRKHRAGLHHTAASLSLSGARNNALRLESRIPNGDRD